MIGFKESAKDPLKQARKKRFAKIVSTRDNILRDSMMFCPSTFNNLSVEEAREP